MSPPTALKIVVSDPWEFQETNNTSTLYGTVSDISPMDEWYVQLDADYCLGDRRFSVVVVSSRHQGFSLRDVFSGRVVAANMSFPDDARYRGPHPGFIGSIELRG